MSDNAWQIHCTRVLLNVLDKSTLSQHQRVREWSQEKVVLAQKQRVIIADVDLSGRNLAEFDFSFVYFARVKFIQASLVRAKFNRAIFLDCSMRGADLFGTSLWLADTKRMDMAEVKNYARANLNTNTEISELNFARPLLIRRAEDHRYKRDILESGIGGIFGRWLVWTDFGAKLLPTLLICLAANLIFGLIYYVIGKLSQGTFILPRGSISSDVRNTWTYKALQES
jgi:uncharacterized protein YjbI with pentapeptide repeats